jgi:hypothetical protein
VEVRQQGEGLVARKRETARLLATSISRSVENAMLEGRPDVIRRLLQDLKTELKDVRRLDVYRRNGVEAFTDLETVNEVNRIAGLEKDLIERISKMGREAGERISRRLFSRAVQSITPQELYETANGSRLMTLRCCWRGWFWRRAWPRALTPPLPVTTTARS